MKAAAYAVTAIALGLFGLWYTATTPDVVAAADSEVAADFPNYYFGGERLIAGRPVYDSLEPEMISTFGLEGYETYPADPPSTVALFAALSLLEYEAAWYLWSAISIVLVAGSIHVVGREVGYPSEWATAIAALALLSNPVRFLVARNHMEALLLALGVAGWLSMRRGNDRAAGVDFGAAAALKLFPGVWLLGVMRRDRRAGLIGLAVAAGGLAVGMAILGPDNTTTFLTDVISRSRRWYGTLGNYSLLSFGTALVASWLGWVLTVIGGGAIMVVYVRKPRPPDQMWIMGTAAALLLSPLAWINYLVLALPALVVLSCAIEWRNPAERLGYALLVVALAFWGPQVFASELVSVLVSFVPTYALVALFFLAAKEQTWSQTSASPSPHSA